MTIYIRGDKQLVLCKQAHATLDTGFELIHLSYQVLGLKRTNNTEPSLENIFIDNHLFPSYDICIRLLALSEQTCRLSLDLAFLNEETMSLNIDMFDKYSDPFSIFNETYKKLCKNCDKLCIRWELFIKINLEIRENIILSSHP